MIIWRMTGGKALGMITGFYEGDIPYTEKTLPFIALGKKLGIPLQIHVQIAYADIYHFKAAIEKAGGTDNMENLIKAHGGGGNSLLSGKDEISNQAHQAVFPLPSPVRSQ